MSFRIDGSISNQELPQLGRQNFDLRGRMLRWYVLFAALLLTSTLILAALMKNRLEEEIKTSLLARAHTIAQAAAQDAAQLDTSTFNPATLYNTSGNDSSPSLLIVSSTGKIQEFFPGDTEIPDAIDWRVWGREVLAEAGTMANGSFITADPDNHNWLHVTATSNNNAQRVLIQQPVSKAFALSRLIIQVWVIALLLFLAGGIFSWLMISREIISPLERLEAYSGVVRWRGEMRPDEQAQISNLAERPDQIGSLARALRAMEADINKRFLQLSTLLETSRVVAASLDVTEVINNILDQVQNLFDNDRCAVIVLDQRADVFRIRASRGLSEKYVQKLRIAPSEPNSLSMRALRNQTPIQVSDTETDLAFATFRPRARSEGYRSVLAIPLFTQHASPAVLLLYKKQPYRYSYSELELASSFGHHASIAMENAALFNLSDEHLHEQTRRLEAIVESLQDGLVLESNDSRVLYFNQRTSELLGMSRRETSQQSSDALIERILSKAVDSERAHTQFADAVAGMGSRVFDLEYKSPTGQNRDLRIHLFDVNDAHGELLGRGQLWQDITKDKEIDRMKSTLLSAVSHELRTPLASIKGYASTLLASDVEWDADSQTEFLQTISDETDRLTKLVKNLMDMSRIEAGLVKMNCELYSFVDLLNEVIHSFDPLLVDRLKINPANKLSPISMDVSRIGTVMRNLMENAAKYSLADSPIELTMDQQNGTALFSVRDYGPGVSPQFQDKIFDRFVRADNRFSQHVGGAGLGLAICKGFVEAHGGRIWVQSAHPGAIFTFSLPIEGACED